MNVVARDLNLVVASSTKPGSVFRWGDKHYLRPCRSLCERGIWGVSLEDGCYIGDGNQLVALVDAEVRVS